MKHPFRDFIESYTEIPNNDWAEIEQYLEKKVFEKGSLILEAGDICRYIYFLESGFLRYFVWKDGEDISKFFTNPPYCFTSQRSLTQEIPARESIEALEESIIWLMPAKAAFDLLTLASWNTFVRKLVQEVQYFTEEILESIQNQTAEERYKDLLESQHIFLQKVPLKHLASYLGIAPQSLSRIRKKILLHSRT